jgi:outer membrane immunogenic protein
MRIGLLALVALALVGACGAAPAADVYPYRAPYTVRQPLNSYSWAGPYIGGNIGYATGDITNSIASPSGIAGGIQGGHNWSFGGTGQWVVGLEGDIQASGASDTFAAWKFSNPWFGTLRGRGGFAMNNILIYGTGGLAFGNVRAEALNLAENHTTAGWTLGAGAEYGIPNTNWTAKAEYLYVNLNNSQFALTGLPNGYQFSVFRLGVNYKFSTY